MKEKVLIVDDVAINRDMLEEALEENYETVQAGNGREALEFLKEFHGETAVVLLDLMMPEVDGFTVLEVMKQQGWLKKIPVLVISSESSWEAENKCFAYGVSDFIQKPFESTLVQIRVKNVVELFSYKNKLEEKVEIQTEAIRKQYRILQLQAKRLQESKMKMLDILGNVVEYRNLESGEHINRVKGFTRILAGHMMALYPEYGLNEEKIEMIVAASALHDIGKIAIPDHILLKPAKLTPDEFEFMKSHTIRGCELLDKIEGVWDDDFRKTGYEICRFHHERFDGRGYPDGLKGEEIPIAAQLVSIADVYDALVHERVYKEAYPKDEAFRMIVTGECGLFSPRLLDIFRKSRKEFEDLEESIDGI